MENNVTVVTAPTTDVFMDFVSVKNVINLNFKNSESKLFKGEFTLQKY